MSDVTLAFQDADADVQPADFDILPRRLWNGKRLVLIAGATVAFAAAAMLLFQYLGPAAARSPIQNPVAIDSSYLKLPDIFVNLASGPGRPRFLKLGVSLEIKGEEQAARIKKNMPRIVDSFQIYLRELRVEDLNGSAGMFLLKEELMRRVNTQLAPARIENVLFEEMLVQ
jgi:flagellar protein FliL